MNGQDLKNSILQLAIQGKLVEQRQEEGTAKELLEQIRAEKEQLVKEGKIKRETPLPEISEDEIPFDIPESWEWTRLGDVLEIARGGSPRPIKAYITNSADGINWIKIGDTDKGGKYINSTNEKIIKEGMNKSRYVRKGDFLLSNSMSFGRPYILNIDGCIHDGWLVLSQMVEIFNRDFLYYLLSSKMVFNQFQSRVAGAVVNNLNSDKVRLTLVPLPPLDEQKRIVAKIEELLPYVSQYDNAHAKVEELNKRFPEEMQKSILQYAIQGKLVEQRQEEGTAEELYQQIQSEKERLVKEGKIKREKPLPVITEEEIPYDIPESWKWVRLGEIGTTNIGLTYKPTDITNEGTIVLRSSNIQDGQLDYNDLVKVSCTIPDNKMCQTGDILICARNGSKRLVGKAAMIDKGGMSFGAFMAIYRSVCNEYILYIINSAYFRNSMLPETGTTTINQITQETLRHCIIPLPPLKEQKRIVAKIEELMPYTKQLVK
ncbi:restriction endonuclease subunit S [Brevibacillus sp. AY1]|uniref:restriction endonuclease subunit S n=1 Tax=Brevibacillus sp. AY1 TaxID=2807621 RepID=UPI002457E677|nr:restriction endonuclease subunit S [Brevibacillus sp. AY1]MDH4618173.1 restriction endonuclease subunit S [Brevibacillus sp. AY1]